MCFQESRASGFFMTFKITTINHIELTVTDLARSKEFYGALPGFKCVADYEDFVMFSVGDFKLGLTTHKNKAQKKFSEFETGLDRVAFEVRSKEELTKAIAFFDEKNINHGEIKKLSNGTLVLAFRDLDNIQLELTCKDI